MKQLSRIEGLLSRLKNRLAQLYYQNLPESTAIALKKKFKHKEETADWEKCTELCEIYSAIRPIWCKPDFAKLEGILGSNQIARSDKQHANGIIGVIVETRKLASLELVIKNFIEQTGLNVQLFHGVNNHEFILDCEIKKLIDSQQVTLYELQTDKLDASAYNALFMSKSFWEAMNTRNKIFVFQTDSYIYPKAESSLKDFLEFDYIGSRWSRKRPIGLIIDGGSGGLSIRDWRKSVACLEQFTPELWQGGEDGYFAFHIELLGGKVGKNKDCGRFSIQGALSKNSYSVHKIVREHL
ncbi:DUF5672 family protein [candidate division CSSED10-310 bacterium]|uniref:DUF5672 family protein n=1 Tax=candidate division CSSED10-310 bacterium TaxID=2855610 RepID=A0ABV6Z2B1_UNCC1